MAKKKDIEPTPFEVISGILQRTQTREHELIESLATVYLNFSQRKDDFTAACATKMIEALAEKHQGYLMEKLLLYDYEPKK